MINPYWVMYISVGVRLSVFANFLPVLLPIFSDKYVIWTVANELYLFMNKHNVPFSVII